VIPLYYHNTERFEIDRKSLNETFIPQHDQFPSPHIPVNLTALWANTSDHFAQFCNDPLTVLTTLNMTHVYEGLFMLNSAVLSFYQKYMPFKRDINDMLDTMQFWSNIDFRFDRNYF
jgi:hypothetical protein